MQKQTESWSCNSRKIRQAFSQQSYFSKFATGTHKNFQSRLEVLIRLRYPFDFLNALCENIFTEVEPVWSSLERKGTILTKRWCF